MFGVINAISGAAWINEADPKPDVLIDSTSYVVATCELAGIPMLSNRAINDAAVDLQAEISRILRLYFSRQLDDGLLHGNGVAPNPQGVFGIAEASTGATLWAAVHDAKSDIVSAGGTPTTLALPPAAITAEEAKLDGQQRPLYPDGLVRYAGLDVVAVPAMAATEGLVYDRSGVYFVVSQDFQITPSTDYAPAYQRNSVALRTSGLFGVGVPVPSMSIRELTITP